MGLETCSGVDVHLPVSVLLRNGDDMIAPDLRPLTYSF